MLEDSPALAVLDLPTAFITSSYLLVVLLDDPHDSTFDGPSSAHLQAVFAMSSLLLVLRQLRVLLNMSSIGPLVLMILRMGTQRRRGSNSEHALSTP